MVDQDKPSSDQQAGRPHLTLKSLYHDIFDGINALIYDPFCNRIVCPIIIALTSIITKIIILKVSYTEIDFKTYMQQIELVNEGELDYSLIKGDTGPIVYPAGFIQIYQILYNITNGGEDIILAQAFFGYLMTFTNFIVLIIYTMVPYLSPWPMFFLILSKRLYSIYVLRLFNDCFTTCLVACSVLVLQQASYWYSTASSTFIFLLNVVAADIYSMAISTKMNALLYLPAFTMVSYFLNGENLLKTLSILLVIPLIQVIVGWKFLLPFFNDEEASYLRWTYLKQAFNLSRKFLYEWTVNWKFVPEHIFLSDYFSTALLVLHAGFLLTFLFTRVLSPKLTGKPLKQLLVDGLTRPFNSTINKNNLIIHSEAGPKLILLIFSFTNMIGVLFSRTLHYQFLSWYCWHLPFLIYASGANFYQGLVLWVLHEYTWNVFPSTPFSSLSLVSVLSFIIYKVWRNERFWYSKDCTAVTSLKKNE